MSLKRIFCLAAAACLTVSAAVFADTPQPPEISAHAAYVMDGNQTELNDFMDQCIQDAYKQTCLPDPQTARDSGSARTWLFEDEMPWTVESGSTGSAKE